MSIVLYDLAGADPNLRFSPYCWRTRFALAHKGLPVETIPWRFTEREAIAFSGQARVPVLRDNERVVHDSWSIAEYLEETSPMLRRRGVRSVPAIRRLRLRHPSALLAILEIGGTVTRELRAASATRKEATQSSGHRAKRPANSVCCSSP